MRNVSSKFEAIDYLNSAELKIYPFGFLFLQLKKTTNYVKKYFARKDLCMRAFVMIMYIFFYYGSCNENDVFSIFLIICI